MAVIDEEENYLGGITANIFMNTMHVGLLASREDIRGQGVGESLLKAAEAKAIAADCKYITIHTQDYQALSFYQKHNYHIFGSLVDAPFKGTDKYYLYKELTGDTKDED